MPALASSQVMSFCVDTDLGKFTFIAYSTSLCPHGTTREPEDLGTDRNNTVSP